MSHLGSERGFGRFNETRMYGRGSGLAEEAEHELELGTLLQRSHKTAKFWYLGLDDEIRSCESYEHNPASPRG